MSLWRRSCCRGNRRLGWRKPFRLIFGWSLSVNHEGGELTLRDFTIREGEFRLQARSKRHVAVMRRDSLRNVCSTLISVICNE